MNVLFLSVISNVQDVEASVISKPLTITAKKVAKELAQNSAVEMAEHILFEKAMSDFLNSDKTSPGYKAVCLDGAKTLDKCSPDKRAQVKETLTASDKSNLSSRVEAVLEQKTNTSSKWGKFLDWFVPIFLLSGLVASFQSMMDSDSEGLIDEIAQQALIESEILKPLIVEETSNEPVQDFGSVVKSVYLEEFRKGAPGQDYEIKLNFEVNANKVLVMNFKGTKHSFTGSNYLYLSVRPTGARVGSTSQYLPVIDLINLGINTRGSLHTLNTRIYQSAEPYASGTDAAVISHQYYVSMYHESLFFAPYDVNRVFNKFAQLMNRGPSILVDFTVPIYEPPPVKTDFGLQQGVQHIKNQDGTVTTPGIEQFTYTYNDKYIYPTPDGTTGWKDKTTGEDVVVQEDEILVDTEIDAPPDEKEEEEEEGEYPTCKKDFKDIEFKKVGVAFTHAFPFSIPWDIKRMVDKTFGGIGDDRPSFKLSFLGDGVELTIPDLIHNWMPFARGIMILLFDISLLYMFYRFMKGGE